MITRRSLSLLVLALALLAPATASADKAKPKSSTPKLLITLTDGAMNRTISPKVTTTFAPPKGTTAAKACKGKVTASVPVGTKTVKKKKKPVFVTKQSSLKNVGGVCTTTAALKLSELFLGKTLKFSATFKGNSAVKKFTKSSKFLLVVATPSSATPVAPPTPTGFVPTPGPWKIIPTDAGTGVTWAMTTGANGGVPSIQRFGSLSIKCEGSTPTIDVDLSMAQFDTPFSIDKTDVTATDEWSSGAEHTTTTFKFHFDSVGRATGTFRVVGAVGGFQNCDSTTIPIDLTPGEFA